MKVIDDVHTHTYYSHAKNSIEEMVEKASMLGLKSIHITEHGKAHWTARKMNMNRYREMKEEIVRLRDIYPQIKIVFGVEANIISTEGDLDFTDSELELFDVVNAGFHMMARMKNIKSYLKITFAVILSHKLKIKIFNRSFRKSCTESLIKAINKYDINMITHPTSYYLIDLKRVANECEKTSTLLEINNSRKKLDSDEINSLIQTDVRFAIGSDAHSVDEVGNFENSRLIVKESGIQLERIVNIE